MLKQTATRLAATFTAAAVPNVLIGQTLDVSAWRAAIMAGGVAVLGVVQALAVSYRDGKLTAAEVEEAFQTGDN